MYIQKQSSKKNDNKYNLIYRTLGIYSISALYIIGPIFYNWKKFSNYKPDKKNIYNALYNIKYSLPLIMTSLMAITIHTPKDFYGYASAFFLNLKSACSKQKAKLSLFWNKIKNYLLNFYYHKSDNVKEISAKQNDTILSDDNFKDEQYIINKTNDIETDYVEFSNFLKLISVAYMMYRLFPMEAFNTEIEENFRSIQGEYSYKNH